MASLLYDSTQFYKKLRTLKKAGGKAEEAANKAWELIKDLNSKNHLSLMAKGKLTKYGEARIENSGKFDLGSGYRLLYVKKDGWFVFLFLGTHDECDNWIKNHTGFKPDIAQGQEVSAYQDESTHSEYELRAEEPLQILDEDRPLHELLDQNILRKIFKGICGSSKNKGQA